jgi:hypothetical protein
MTYGLPFFDAFASSDAILERLRSGAAVRGTSSGQTRLVWAMLAKNKGHLGEAERQIHDALAET